MQIKEYMKESGKMIINMERVTRNTIMEQNTKETSQIIDQMVWVHIPGPMGNSMRESGLKDLNMALACGEAYVVTLILANGSSEKLTEMVYILGLMAIDTRVNSDRVLNMEKEQKSLVMGIVITEATKMVNQAVMASIFGQMEAFLRVTSRMD
jgi:hypothetical protein